MPPSCGQVILCLPDAAAIEAASLVDPCVTAAASEIRPTLSPPPCPAPPNQRPAHYTGQPPPPRLRPLPPGRLRCRSNTRTVLIDASTAHRVDPSWAYGFPELDPGQRDRISQSRRISNPGCYSTGFIALVK